MAQYMSSMPETLVPVPSNPTNRNRKAVRQIGILPEGYYGFRLNHLEIEFLI